MPHARPDPAQQPGASLAATILIVPVHPLLQLGCFGGDQAMACMAIGWLKD